MGLVSLVSVSATLAFTVAGPWIMVFWGGTVISCAIFYGYAIYEEKKRLTESKSYVNRAIRYREQERVLHHQEYARRYCSILSLYQELGKLNEKKVSKIVDAKIPAKSSLIIERTRE